MKSFEYYELKRIDSFDFSQAPIEPKEKDYVFSHEGVEQYHSDLEAYKSDLYIYERKLPKKKPYTEFHEDCCKEFGMEECSVWTRILFSTKDLMKSVAQDLSYATEFEIIKHFCDLYKATKKSVILDCNNAISSYHETAVDEEDHK